MITADRVTTGLSVGTGPPLRRVDTSLRAARLLGFDAAWTVDHFLGFVPQSVWDGDFSWMAAKGGSPHQFFDYQALLGHLARRAGGVQLAVGVTEPTRRHPVLLAQTFLTLAHMTRRAPILGIGSGERENIEPYGLDFTSPVARLEEALPIIRRCFTSRGPFDHRGRHFRLAGAVMDLTAPAGRTPQIWLAAHGPRTLRLTGEFGDGWYPARPMSPQRYAASWEVVRQAARRVDRDPDRIVPGWQTVIVVGRTERAARRLLASRAVRFAALLAEAEAWEEHGLSHPFGNEYRGFVDFVPQRRSRAELDAAIEQVPVDLLADNIPWGTPNRLHAILREYVDAGLRHLVMQPLSALVSRADAVYSLQAMVRVARRLKE